MLKSIVNICFVNNKLQVTKKSIVTISIFNIAITMLSIMRTEIVRKLFDFVSGDYDVTHMVLMLVGMIGVYCVSLLTNVLMKNYIHKCRFILHSKLNQEMTKYSLKMDAWKNNYSDSTSRYIVMNKEVNEYVGMVYVIVPTVISWIIMLVGYSIYLWSISSIAVVVTIIVEIVIWNVSKKIQAELAELNEERRTKYRNWFSFMQKTFENLFIMRETVNFRKYCTLYDKKAKEWNDSSVKGLSRLLTVDQIQNAGALLVDIVLITIGIVNLLNGQMEIGAVYSMIVSVQLLKNEFKKMPDLIDDIYAAQVHNKQINDFFTNNSFVEADLDGYKGTNEYLLKGIEIKDLNFSYTNEVEVIRNFSYRFESGKIYAVTGIAGTGKTTLLLLLAKLLQPKRGDILYDGQDIKNIERTSLWQKVRFVSKPCFVKGNFYGNIAFGRNEIELSIYNKIKMYEDKLWDYRFEDEVCNQLSAGEKQRLLIYRAVCSKSQVLLLDEPFANLDRNMECSMMDLLLEAKALGKCIIFTTHRTEYLSQCDGVINFSEEGIVC